MRSTLTLLSAVLLGVLLTPSPNRRAVAGEGLSGQPALRIRGVRQISLGSLQHVLQLTERIYSGAQPDGEAAFAEIAKLGVRTVVSVDGARPNLEAAERAGLRYVHIPIGYDGVDRHASASLVNLVRSADAPLYIHCHHGKHRGPAAAAIACIAAGSTDNHAAVEILVQAGTSEHYAGLYRDVRRFEMPPAEAPLPELVSVAEVNSMASLMVVIDQAHEHLRRFDAQGWGTLDRHPDLHPHHEAQLLREGFREALRLRSSPQAKQPAGDIGDGDAGDDRKHWAQMAAAEKEAEQLAAALQQHELAEATRRLQSIGDACAKCHAAYRD
ncbi:MAG: hypothetical protein ACF788_13270 [Novipirellula sp. JB048]